MLKKTLAALALVALVAAPAYAGDLDAAFGNTVRVTTAAGATVQYLYNADHTYTMVAPDGAHVSGAWATRGGQLCTTPTGGHESCVPLQPNHKVGDNWTQSEADGSTVTIAIVAGHS